MPGNPKDFLLNTDYEMDKVVLVKTGSFVQQLEIDPALNFVPLPFGVWSLDSNFSSTNPLGVYGDSADPSDTPPLGVRCTVYNGKITLTAYGENANSANIYYRLYAFIPSTSNEDAPVNSDLANTFILNTDYNYRKLKASGEFTSSGQTYTHDLGYLPQVMAWSQQINGAIDPLWWYSSAPMPEFGLNVTDSKIECTGLFPTSTVEKIIWRIYYDEA